MVREWSGEARQQVLPQVLLVEGETVTGYGGQVALIDDLTHHSTSRSLL